MVTLTKLITGTISKTMKKKTRVTAPLLFVLDKETTNQPTTRRCYGIKELECKVEKLKHVTLKVM